MDAFHSREQLFFGAKVHSRRALRFGPSSRQAWRDLRCSGPHKLTPFHKTDKTLLPEGRGAGSAGWSNSRSGRWAGTRWSSEKRRGSDTAEVSNDSPGIVLLKLWNACANWVHFSEILATTFYSHTWNYSSTISPLGYTYFYYNIIDFRKKNHRVKLQNTEQKTSPEALIWHTVHRHAGQKEGQARQSVSFLSEHFVISFHVISVWELEELLRASKR